MKKMVEGLKGTPLELSGALPVLEAMAERIEDQEKRIAKLEKTAKAAPAAKAKKAGA